MSSSTSPPDQGPSTSQNPLPRRRSRVVSGDNPFESPLTSDEQAVANLIRQVNIENERDNRDNKNTTSPPTTASAPASPPTMSYQNYMEPGPSNPRQAPPSPSQSLNHNNGMNGAMGIGGGMVGFPTPAGHQSDLNYIMNMIDEFTLISQGNQRLTAGVVDKIGKVTERAKHLNLSNDELISLVSQELEDESKNLEKELSDMRKKLQKAQYDADENWKLVIHGCNILADVLEKVHKFKETAERDVLLWHNNYRNQLAVEREQNLTLNNQINDMRAAACRANEHLRGLRRALTDDENRHEIKIRHHAYRAENRFWKRMAMPYRADDDSEWSDDDDLSDPVLKRRLRQLYQQEIENQAQAAAEKAKNEVEGGNASAAAEHVTIPTL